MAMLQLVYASRPFGFNEASLNGILNLARHYNTRDDITGALICRDDIFLQLLEGPQDLVEAAYVRIARDSRHLEINQLVSRPISERMFPQWAMRDDPAHTWMWSRADVENGAVERASCDDVLAVFTRLAESAPQSVTDQSAGTNL